MKALLLVSAALLAGAAPVEGTVKPGYAPTWSIAPEFSLSPYSESPGDDKRPARALAVGVHATRRWDKYGAGLALELNTWRGEDLEENTDFFVTALVGPEFELLSVGGRLRHRFAAGLAILIDGSENDERGGVGFYADIRPVGFRWKFDHFILGFDPMSLLANVPDAGGIPLVDIQYRGNVYMEFGL